MSTNGAGGPSAVGGRTGGTRFGGRPLKALPFAGSLGVDLLVVVAVVVVINVVLGIDSALLSGAVSGALVALISAPVYRWFYDRTEAHR